MKNIFYIIGLFILGIGGAVLDYYLEMAFWNYLSDLVMKVIQ